MSSSCACSAPSARLSSPGWQTVLHRLALVESVGCKVCVCQGHFVSTHVWGCMASTPVARIDPTDPPPCVTAGLMSQAMAAARWPSSLQTPMQSHKTRCSTSPIVARRCSHFEHSLPSFLSSSERLQKIFKFGYSTCCCALTSSCSTDAR